MGPRKWIVRLLALFILSALWMPGCGDKEEDKASEPWVAQVVEVTPALGTYYVGGSEGVFNLVEDNTSSLVLELLPASPDLDPGNFLVGLDGEGFIREVLTQEQTDPRDPNWVIVDTTSATIPDAFTEFDLDLGINTGQTLTPGMVSSCIPNSACINISNEVLYDDGTVRVTITSGSISVYANYWGTVRLRERLYDIHYKIIAEGSATLRFEVIGAGTFNREVTVPGTSFRIPIQIGWVPLTLKGAIKAGFTLGYSMDSTVDVTVDFQRGTVGSLYYDTSTGWTARSTDLSEGLSIPSIDFTGEVDVSADAYLKPELSVSIFDVVGIGASVEPYLQVRVDAAWTPCTSISWGKFWRGGIRADISAFAFRWLGIPDLVYPIGDWTLLQGDEQSRNISGTLFNGTPGDPVVLSGDAIDTTSAAANGFYCFTDLPRGSYCVNPPTVCGPPQTCDSIVDSDLTGIDFSCCAPGGRPCPPTGVSAAPGDAQVTITWNPSAGATSHNIYWATASGVTAGTGSQIPGVTSPYVHGGLTNGTRYYYVVTALNGTWESAESSEVNATPTGGGPPPPGGGSPPNPPTGLSADAGSYSVMVCWDPVPDATFYNIYYGTAPGVTKETGIKDYAFGDEQGGWYWHSGVSFGTTYYYVATSLDSNLRESDESAEVSITPLPGNPIPPWCR